MWNLVHVVTAASTGPDMLSSDESDESIRPDIWLDGDLPELQKRQLMHHAIGAIMHELKEYTTEEVPTANHKQRGVGAAKA